MLLENAIEKNKKVAERITLNLDCSSARDRLKAEGERYAFLLSKLNDIFILKM